MTSTHPDSVAASQPAVMPGRLSALRPLAPVAAAVPVYFLLASLGVHYFRGVGDVAGLWLANAAIIGLYWHRRDLGLPALLACVAIGSLAAKAAAGVELLPNLLMSTANALETGMVIVLMRAAIRDWTSIVAPILCMVFAAVVAPMAAGLLGAAAGLVQTATTEGYWSAWWLWWTGSALGAFCVLPIVFAADRHEIRQCFTGWTAVQTMAGGVLCCGFSYLVLATSEIPLIMIAPALMLVAAVLGPLGSALVSALCVGLILADVPGTLTVFPLADPDSYGLPPQLALALAIAPAFLASTVIAHYRRHESRMRASEHALRNAMDNAAIGMAIVAPDGRLSMVNRALADMLGYTTEELLRLRVDDFSHPEDMARDDAEADKLLIGQGDSYRMEKRYVTKDGRLVWGQLTVSIVRDEETGEPRQFIAQIENIDQRRQAENALAESESRWSFALESARQGVWDWDIARRHTYYSPTWKAILGYRPDEIGDDEREWSRLIHPDDLPRARELEDACVNGGCSAFESELRMRHRDGHWVWVLDRGRVVSRDAAGRALRMIGTHADISARKQAEQDLKSLSAALFEEKERLRVTLYSIGDSVICTDTEGRITFMNHTAEEMTGWPSGDAHGRPIEDVFGIVEAESGEPLASPVRASLEKLEPFYLKGDVVLIDRQGNRRNVQDSAAPIRDASGQLMGAVLVFQDVTEQRMMQRQLAYSSQHDSLTGLPNRLALETRLAEVSDMVGTGDGRFTLCFLDLDRFKILNDSAGHAAGDALLVEVADRLRGAVREGDMIARLGGDEFALLLADSDIERAEELAHQVVAALAAIDFWWAARNYRVSASIGIAEVPATPIPVGELMSRADVACYAAKASGRNRISAYRPDESEARRYHRDIQIASSIRPAIAADRFRLFAQRIEFLQPKCAGRRYYEILLRLEDEQGQLMLPGSFIPAAERYDLMGEIDRWVIRNTLRRLGRMQEGIDQDCGLAVNLSANSLNDPGLWDFVSAELAASGMTPGRLHFEITETALIDNLDAASAFVTEARAAGCGVTLDDFGAGLSSFSYLRQFPVDQLKIDGNFIRQLRQSAVDRAIVESINDLGHKFGARTIAEFVEDQETLCMLRDIGVDMAQGYTVARPQPIEVVFPELAPQTTTV